MPEDEAVKKRIRTLEKWMRSFGIVGLLLGVLSMLVLLEGWIVKGSHRDKAKPPALAQAAKIQSLEEEAVWKEIQAPVPPAPPASETEVGGFLTYYLPWLRNALPDRINIDWGDSAGALAGAAAAFLTIATLLFMRVEALESDARYRRDQAEQKTRYEAQDRRSQELVDQMKAQAMQMENQSQNAERQLQLMREMSELNSYQSQMAALTAKLHSTRARIETLWKGSRMDFGDQVFATDDQTFAHLLRELTHGMKIDSPEHKLMVKDLENWRETTEKIEKIIAHLDRNNLDRADAKDVAHSSVQVEVSASVP